MKKWHSKCNRLYYWINGQIQCYHMSIWFRPRILTYSIINLGLGCGKWFARQLFAPLVCVYDCVYLCVCSVGDPGAKVHWSVTRNLSIALSVPQIESRQRRPPHKLVLEVFEETWRRNSISMKLPYLNEEFHSLVRGSWVCVYVCVRVCVCVCVFHCSAAALLSVLAHCHSISISIQNKVCHDFILDENCRHQTIRD